MNNTRVLACQIDEELREKMQIRMDEEQKLTGKKLTVKNYIARLIEEDLEKYKAQKNLQSDVKEQQVDKSKTDILKNQPVVENQKEEKKLLAEDKKAEKKQPVVENKKANLKKQPIKKKQKEEEEEFE